MGDLIEALLDIASDCESGKCIIIFLIIIAAAIGTYIYLS